MSDPQTPPVAAEELVRRWNDEKPSAIEGLEIEKIGDLMSTALASQAREIEGHKKYIELIEGSRDRARDERDAMAAEVERLTGLLANAKTEHDKANYWLEQTGKSADSLRAERETARAALVEARRFLIFWGTEKEKDQQPPIMGRIQLLDAVTDALAKTGRG